ncbi:helix-turn-helix domain-containing protein [Chitinophaga sp. 30R24]|uniref:helix-turn-helix domain-containing protein n=1 Tax=Chitinophaga sp. 30R24 TaxID=3248838 RepID=UPI003B922214
MEKVGFIPIQPAAMEQLHSRELDDFIKIAFIAAGGSISIDCKKFEPQQDALFFINAGLSHQFNSSCNGNIIFYNPHFYPQDIYDHPPFEHPIFLPEGISPGIQTIFLEIQSELEHKGPAMEGMLYALIKQLTIKCIRIAQETYLCVNQPANKYTEFWKKFNQLVDIHYTHYHTVAEYAELLHISAKSLNKCMTKYFNATPNQIIKNRILLEAKQLLSYTLLSVKEIGYKLGYEDISYFIRFFSKHVDVSPQKFRLQRRNPYL